MSHWGSAMGVHMKGPAPARLADEGVDALVRMEDALELLDRCDEAADVGAHLDLAICRLREVLAQMGVTAPPRSGGPEV